MREYEVGLQRDEFFRETLHQVQIDGCRPASIDPSVAAVGPPKLREFVPECRDIGLCFRVALGIAHQTPIRRTRSGCCPRAPTGNASIEPPNIAMNSRRLTRPTIDDGNRLSLHHLARGALARLGGFDPRLKIFCS